MARDVRHQKMEDAEEDPARPISNVLSAASPFPGDIPLILPSFSRGIPMHLRHRS